MSRVGIAEKLSCELEPQNVINVRGKDVKVVKTNNNEVHWTSSRLIGGEGLRTGVTCFDNLLVARWLGHDASAVRQSYGMIWAAFRGVVRGLPPRMPSIWNM